MFVLPNIWDAGSAVVFEKQGFKALATTSAGVAYSLGYPDGEAVTLDDLAVRIREITRRIHLPLSVDFERGYSETSEGVKENARQLIDCVTIGSIRHHNHMDYRFRVWLRVNFLSGQNRCAGG